VRSYTLSVNKQTVEQEFVCVSDSEQCYYAWNVADHEAGNYVVSVAANNVVGQSVTKNCTTTPIGEHKLRHNNSCLDTLLMIIIELVSSCLLHKYPH